MFEKVNCIDCVHLPCKVGDTAYFVSAGGLHDFTVGTMEEAPESEPNAGTPRERLSALFIAHKRGIKTWISAEPVLNPSDVINLIDLADYVNLWKVGKLNYHPSDIDWKEFGERAECLLRAKKRNRLDFDYYIKDSLRAEMEANR